jgi:hypothetical protein
MTPTTILILTLLGMAAGLCGYYLVGVWLRLAHASWRAEREVRQDLEPDPPSWTERVRRLRPLLPALYTAAGVLVSAAVDLWAFVVLFAIAHAVALLRPHLDRIVHLLQDDSMLWPADAELPTPPPAVARLRALDDPPVGRDPR